MATSTIMPNMKRSLAALLSFSIVLGLYFSLVFFRPLILPPSAKADTPSLVQLTQTIRANEYIDTAGDEFSYTFTPVTDINELTTIENKLNVSTCVIPSDKYPQLSASVTATAMESGSTTQTQTIDVTIPEYDGSRVCSDSFFVYKVNAFPNFHEGHSEYISDASYYLLINDETWGHAGVSALTPDDIKIVQIKDDMNNDVDFEIKDKLAFIHWYWDTVATQIDFATENTALGSDSVVPMLLVVTPPDNYQSLSPRGEYEAAIHASAAYVPGARVTGTGNLAVGSGAAAQGYYNIAYGGSAQASGWGNQAYQGGIAGGYATAADNGGLTIDYTVAVPVSNIPYFVLPYREPLTQAVGTRCSDNNAAQAIGLSGTADNAWCVLYYARNGEGGGPVFTDIPVGARYEVFAYPGSFDYAPRDAVFAPEPPSLTDFPEELWLATYSNPGDKQTVIDHWDTAGWDGSALRGVFHDTSAPIYIRDYMEYFSVYFDGNGAESGETAAIFDKPEGTNVTLTPNGFIREGYTFKGWASSVERANSGVVDYADEADFTFPRHDTTLYAVWEEDAPLTYSLYFDGNGAESGETAAIVDKPEGTNVTLTPNGYVRTNHTFQGWATSLERANAGTVDYVDEADFTFPHRDTTLYAVWKEFVPPATGVMHNSSIPIFPFLGGSIGALIGIFVVSLRRSQR